MALAAHFWATALWLRITALISDFQPLCYGLRDHQFYCGKWSHFTFHSLVWKLLFIYRKKNAQKNHKSHKIQGFVVCFFQSCNVLGIFSFFFLLLCFSSSSSNSQPVHFYTMTCGQNKVRRLSTCNSVIEPTYMYTTEWLWYWEDEKSQWNLYAVSCWQPHLRESTAVYCVFFQFSSSITSVWFPFPFCQICRSEFCKFSVIRATSDESAPVVGVQLNRSVSFILL